MLPGEIAKPRRFGTAPAQDHQPEVRAGEGAGSRGGPYRMHAYLNARMSPVPPRPK